MQIFIPFSGYVEAMDFSHAELAQVNQLLNHVFFGLHSDSLIDNTWQYGPQESMTKFFANATEGGIVCGPSALGAELFLWAFGHADKPLEFIFDSAFSPRHLGGNTAASKCCSNQNITPIALPDGRRLVFAIFEQSTGSSHTYFSRQATLLRRQHEQH